MNGSSAQNIPESSPATFDHLQTELPSIIWRHQWDRFAEKHGLPFRKSTLQNIDSEGCGPPQVFFGTKVGYPRESLIAWLNQGPPKRKRGKAAK